MKNIFNVLSAKTIDDSIERYVVAAVYLLFLKYKKTPNQIESIDFNVGEIMESIGLGFGWGINTTISNFIKKYRTK